MRQFVATGEPDQERAEELEERLQKLLDRRNQIVVRLAQTATGSQSEGVRIHKGAEDRT